MIDQDPPLQDDEDAAFAEAEARIEAMRNGGTPPAPAASEPEAGTQPEPAPDAGAPPPTDEPEPFPGYRDLPEGARAQFDEFRRQAAEAAATKSALEKREAEFRALQGRLGPVQAENERYRRQMQQQPAQAPQPRPSLAFTDWLKSQTPERQRQLQQFPEEAQAHFEVARDLVDREVGERIRAIEEQTNARLSQFEVKAELSVLAREHPDYQQYGPTNTGFWEWVAAQGPEVSEAANSTSAQDIAAVLSLKKWEQANPIVSETYADPAFHSWLSTQSRTLRQMPQSLDIGDRATVINLFIGHLESQVQTDPKAAARVDTLAKRREQQNRVSPSIRPSVAPAQAAANRGGEDAEFAAAEARIQQWRQRQ